MKINFSRAYNSLPFSVRFIANVVSNEMRINQLKMEKARLIRRHRQSLKEINEHISNIENGLKHTQSMRDLTSSQRAEVEMLLEPESEDK